MGAPEARAVEIALQLRRLYGEGAQARADRRRDDAIDAGQTGRADLYVAVCAIIADRGEVFHRSRLTP